MDKGNAFPLSQATIKNTNKTTPRHAAWTDENTSISFHEMGECVIS